MKQIVCLSTSPWYPIPTRKQQVMSRLGDAEILYFDPPVTYLAAFKDPTAREKRTAYKKPGEKIQENLTVYSLPPVLPFLRKYRAINRLTQKRQARFVKKICKAHGFQNPILWCYSPTAADLVGRIPHAALVYDCVDRHSAYGGLSDPAMVDAMELELAEQADAVFATAQSLCDRLRTVHPEAVFLPNGANFERFYAASQPQPCPEDFPEGDGPVFGFVGALQDCIEYSYVAFAANRHPDWRFVFLGRQLPGVDLAELKALPNCHFLGLKPNEQLPRYIAQFDACLNLFRDCELSRDVSPLKFYEYLATGKPVVSTPMPEQVLQFAEVIHLAHSPEEFAAACEAALSDSNAAARIEYGRQSSWDSRVAQMEAILSQKGIL